MLTPLRNAYYLSFPVVLGAVLSNRMAARLGISQLDADRLPDESSVHWATPVVLALVVFVIYAVDRLLDGQKVGEPLTARLHFHRRYAPLLWRVVVAAIILTFVLVWFLPSSVIKFGIVLGGLCAAYLAAVFRLPARHPALLLKEPLVALLYSAGVWGSVWVQRPTISGIEITECFMFTGIAFQNLLLFAVMELGELPNQDLFSLASAWGVERCELLLRWLTFLIVATGVSLCFLTEDRFAQRSSLMLAIMSLMLYVIQRYPAYFLRNERYRWLGDGVFWLPALVL
ncbi:hypothetical protein [Spirosoma pomorum]